MAHAVPVDGEATFGEIAERVGLDEINVARLMRHAMGNRIFREVREGVVAHSAKSRVLREDGGMDDVSCFVFAMFVLRRYAGFVCGCVLLWQVSRSRVMSTTPLYAFAETWSVDMY